MKALLGAVKARLESTLDGVRAVYVLPDRALLPKSASFPAVGLRDGAILLDHGAVGRCEAMLRIEATCYERLLKVESAMMGEAGSEGILGLVARVRAHLSGWCPEGYSGGRCLGEEPTELVLDEGGLLLARTAAFEWQRTEEVPGA